MEMNVAWGHNWYRSFKLDNFFRRRYLRTNTSKLERWKYVAYLSMILAHCVPLPDPGPPRTKMMVALSNLAVGLALLAAAFDAAFLASFTAIEAWGGAATTAATEVVQPILKRYWEKRKSSVRQTVK